MHLIYILVLPWVAYLCVISIYTEICPINNVFEKLHKGSLDAVKLLQDFPPKI